MLGLRCGFSRDLDIEFSRLIIEFAVSQESFAMSEKSDKTIEC